MLTHTTVPEPEKLEEVIETSAVVEDEKMEEVNDIGNHDEGEQIKAKEEEEEEEEKVEEEINDDDELFSSEFDTLMGTTEFNSEMGFGENLEWMNEV